MTTDAGTRLAALEELHMLKTASEPSYEDPRWARLNDGQNYKVYRNPNWAVYRYTAATPKGSVLTCAMTLWGAKRAVRKHKAKMDATRRLRWWEMPEVYATAKSSR